MDRSEKIIIISLAAIIACCICVSLPVYLLAKAGVFSSPVAPTPLPSSTSHPTPTRMPDAPTTGASEPLDAAQTLEILRHAILPSVDPYSLASRFRAAASAPQDTIVPAPDFAIGDRQKFWIWEDDRERNRQVDASLRYATDDVYFWIEDEIPYDQTALKTLVETFSNEIYPKDHLFFGSEPVPGVDYDPHLYVLYARGLGESIAGYMSAGDLVSPDVYEYSNAHEMFSINADIQSLSDPYTLGVMAHELQHLIHQSQDPNEELWLNEGFSELAAQINGYQAGGFDSVFLHNPDMQLNDWSNGEEDSTPHYGASYLFVTYMMGRFGEEFTRSVVASEDNGLMSIDETLSGLGITDPQTGKPVTSVQLFADWAVANFVQDPAVSDGRYSYEAYPEAPNAGPTERQTRCKDLQEERSVSQYGTDYVQLICGAPSVFTFKGQDEVKIIPDDPQDGSAFMWSNVGNSSDMALTREFDLRNLQAPVSLTFDAWYDFEPLYDFGYVLASEDDGETWISLAATGCTRENSTGNNYGCGFNGSSNGWQAESVNLSHYAGQKILLRFESITDGAVLGEGFAVDNISIPEMDYFEDFNISDGTWEKDGFVRIVNALPQTYAISVIDQNTQTLVTQYFVTGAEPLEIPIRSGNDLFPVTIAVSGTTDYSRQKAEYQYSVVYSN